MSNFQKNRYRYVTLEWPPEQNLQYNKKETDTWKKIYFNTLCIYDMIEYSSVVFMFKVYNNQFPRHLLCFFERLYDSHSHNTRKKVNNFKIKYSRTSQKASCVSVIGPKLWNNLHSDLQCSTSISRFKNHYKRMLLQRYEHLD